MSMVERVLELVRDTRPLLLPHWGSVDGTRKSEDEYSLVTELDVAIERYLLEGLERIDPAIGFVGEESGGSRDQSRFWLCDPIDGTLQFARGLPFCTVQLALIEQGEVTFSVIYDFLGDVMYHAARGEGAFQNTERMRVSNRPLERSILILETQLHKRPKNLEFAERLSEKFHTMRSLVAGYELVLVATGKVEGRLCFDPWGKDYDYAAGTLLIREAGGIVANIGASSYGFQNLDFLAATPAVYQALTEGAGALLPLPA